MRYICLTFTILLTMISCKPYSKFLFSSSEKFRNNYKFDSEIDNMLKQDSLDPDYQLSATFFALKSDHRNALIHWDLATNPDLKDYSNEKKDSLRSEFTIKSAKEYIIKQSKKNKILIINESHHNASHRVFVESLLFELYKNGYKNLCLEALDNGDERDSLLIKRKYPIQSSGFYTANTSYGNLIRTALKIGFQIYCYETTQMKGGEPREIDQANNLAKIIKGKPGERFLVYCGAGHALEGQIDFFGGSALAERIHELTGLNPLTVDQVFFSEKSQYKFEHPILKTFNFEEPSVIINKENVPFSYKEKNAWIDIAVFHPNTTYINYRPVWLIYDKKELVRIDLRNIDISFPILVMAFYQNENLNEAVPADIVEIKNINDSKALVLGHGNYNIIIVNKNNEYRQFSKSVQ